MSIDPATEAAGLLDAELRPYPEYITIGVGTKAGAVVLIVYAKKRAKLLMRAVPSVWKGYPVSVHAIGTPRPL